MTWTPPSAARRRYTGVYQAPSIEDAARAGIDPEKLELLRDPRIALPMFGAVVDQASGVVRAYDPTAICPELQLSVLDFIGDTPKTADGMNMWWFELGPRQSGKSVTTALAADNHAGRVPGQTVVTIADIKERADDLFRKTTISYDRMVDMWPQYAPVSSAHQETRKRTYPDINSIYYTMSTQQGNVGIGRSPDFVHLSEAPFHKDLGDFLFKFLPAIRNRAEAIMVSETTPAPMTEPSAEAARELAELAMTGESRWRFHFTPYYASLLNERAWPQGERLTDYETNLLLRYGPKGNQRVSGRGLLTHLTLENLAFRRETIKEDPVIRRYPELFDVFYPLDPLTCWSRLGGGVIPSHALERHQARLLVPWNPGETLAVYRDPRPGATYVVGVDPAGYGDDHASFQILEVWGDTLIQCVEYSSPNVTPTEFADLVAEYATKYNGALIGVERNGVGIAVIERLKTLRAEGKRLNLYYKNMGADQPAGIWSSKASNDEALAVLIDELLDRLVLYSQNLVGQLGSYRNDKSVEDSEKFKLLNPGKLGQGRRGKHHWDRVSALGFACIMAREVPARSRPAHVDIDRKEFDPDAAAGAKRETWTVADQRAYRKLLEAEARKDALAKKRAAARTNRRNPKKLEKPQRTGRRR